MADVREGNSLDASLQALEGSLRDTIGKDMADVVAVSPEIIESVRQRGRALGRLIFRSRMPDHQVVAGTRAWITELHERSKCYERLLDRSMEVLRSFEAALANLPAVGAARMALTMALGVLASLAATTALALMMVGPVTRFITLPLLADAVAQSAGLLSLLGETLGARDTGIDPFALHWASTHTVFLLGGCTTLALSIAVVLGPDLASLSGGRAGRLTMLLLVLAKSLFAAAFYVIRAPDVAGIHLPILAGSVFEASLMASSSFVAWTLGHRLNEWRERRRGRARAAEGIYAVCVWQARLKQRLAEIADERTALATDSFLFHANRDVLVADAEAYGEVAAELCLLRQLAHNERQLQEQAAGHDVDPLQPHLSMLTN